MHSSRSRGRSRRASEPILDLRCGLHEEGNVHSNNRIKMLRTGYDSNCGCGSPPWTNSITFELKRSSSKKASGMPIKALINEEMSREKHIKRSSPSLIARLMGLDSLPSSVVLKPHKSSKNHSRRPLSNELHEKFTTHEDLPLQSSSDEHNFKDVYEVVETAKVENQKKQIDHALVALSSYKDVYQEFLPEPHCLSPKYFPYGSCSPLKGSPSASCESSIRLERNVEPYINKKEANSHTFQKLTASHCSLPSREHICALLQKLSESTYARKDEDCIHPTQIVILKPSLDNKVQKKERKFTAVKSLNHTEFPGDDVLELYAEERALGKLHSTSEYLENRRKELRETAKGVRKEMKKNISTERKKISDSVLHEHANDEGSWKMSRINQHNLGTSNWSSANLCDYSCSSSTSSCPSESSVSWEARKHLSDRWKLTNHSQDMGPSSRVSGTLGEMLALSDNEAPKMILDTSFVKKSNVRKMMKDDLPKTLYSPLGISSKDGWKKEFSRNLPRSKSKSLLASPLVHNNSQCTLESRRRNSPNRYMPKNVQEQSNSMLSDEDLIQQKNTSLRNLRYHSNKSKPHYEEEINAIEREIHVSSEILKIEHEQQAAFELSDDSNAQSSEMADNFSVPQCKIEKYSLTTEYQLFEKLQDFVESDNDGKLSDHDCHEILSKEVSVEHGGEARVVSHSTFAASHNDVDQPSPVSVLDMPSEEENSTSVCFEKISADIEELRMQLRLLKMESPGSFTEETEALVSGDEDAGDMVQTFRDEEERDYSYLLDIFTYSVVFNFDQDELFNSSHWTENLTGMQVFYKLEKKYESIESSWSRSDRMLMFDIMNSILIDIKKEICGQPKMVDEGLVDEVWLRLVKQKKEFGRISEELTGLKWVDLGDDEELVEREIEIMLHEELMNELVLELIFL